MDPFEVVVSASSLQRVLAFLEDDELQDSIDDSEVRPSLDSLSLALHLFALTNPEFDDV